MWTDTHAHRHTDTQTQTLEDSFILFIHCKCDSDHMESKISFGCTVPWGSCTSVTNQTFWPSGDGNQMWKFYIISHQMWEFDIISHQMWECELDHNEEKITFGCTVPWGKCTSVTSQTFWPLGDGNQMWEFYIISHQMWEFYIISHQMWICELDHNEEKITFGCTVPWGSCTSVTSQTFWPSDDGKTFLKQLRRSSWGLRP